MPIEWKTKRDEEGQILDYAGRAIRPGDVVVHATSHGRSATLDTSVVVGVNPEKGTVIIRKLEPSNDWAINYANRVGETAPEPKYWSGPVKHPTRNCLIVGHVDDPKTVDPEGLLSRLMEAQ